MSKIEELIQELCPNGIKYYLVNDVVKLNNYHQLGAAELEDLIVKGGDIPLLPSSRNYDWFTTKEVAADVLCYGEVFTMGRARHANTKYVKGYFVSANNIIIETKDPDIVLTRYLFHYLTNKISEFYIKTSTYPKFDNDLFKNMEIPIPPIEVQSEIVRILDNFTLLTAELTAELTARKEQYEYYREHLFGFEKDKTDWIPIEKLFDIKGGYTPSKDKSEYWENGIIPWFRLDDINKNGRILFDANQHITKSAVKKNGPFLENSIIITTSATIGEYALIKVPFVCNQRFTCLTLKKEYINNYNMKFLLYYCFKLSIFCKEHLNKGNFASVDMAKFKQFKFPMITMSKQNEIVELLDKFEEYCNDITQGLPAEIELRQKQYEYYRDKLLTFKELE